MVAAATMGSKSSASHGSTPATTGSRSRGQQRLIEAAEAESAPWFSEGSRAHASGQCKPCAFFHDKGCQTGKSCSFCHLCPPREVQRRKRIRRRIAREMLAREEDQWSDSVPRHGLSHFSLDSGSPESPEQLNNFGMELAAGAPIYGAPWIHGHMYFEDPASLNRWAIA